MNADLHSSQSSTAVRGREASVDGNSTDGTSETSEDDYYADDDYESSEDGFEEAQWKTTFHLLACHEDLVNSVVDNLNSGTGVVEAWLCACQELPGVHDLADLKRLHPTAMPSWLALENPDIRVGKLHVRPGNHVLFKKRLAFDTQARAAARQAQLERFRRCRFQDTLASEGMLCNSPPIPLRVLDYLEAADLLSLSLVCKATHHASHYLFQREEEVLNHRTLGFYDLHPRHVSTQTRHRIMRAASLMCGKPVAFNYRNLWPSLLRNLVASPDACTQPRVSWSNRSEEHRVGLTEIVSARRVAPMGDGRRVRVYRVDPEGWPSRDQGALVKLRRMLRRRLRSASDESDAQREKQGVKKSLKRVGKVFEAALRHHHAVLLFQE